MDFAVYERIWNEIIKPKIEEMQSSDDDILFIGDQIKDKIWIDYEGYKNSVHTYMRNPDGRIDRHKIASVLLYSIIANRPFALKYLHSKKEIKTSASLANETLGFYTALAIVWCFIMEEANQEADNGKIEMFKDGFIFPECKHESYPTHVYKMLYYSKLNKCYDIFAFSHVLFLIEAYTELAKKNELADRIQ